VHAFHGIDTQSINLLPTLMFCHNNSNHPTVEIKTANNYSMTTARCPLSSSAQKKMPIELKLHARIEKRPHPNPNPTSMILSTLLQRTVRIEVITLQHGDDPLTRFVARDCAEYWDIVIGT
jgi:hypothetical protein